MRNFFRKNIKIIIVFLIGVILSSCITVYAYSCFASDVSYTKDGKTMSVSDALNDLYTKTNTYKKLDIETTATADEILKDYTAYNNNGSLITGTYIPKFKKDTFSVTTENMSISLGFQPSNIFVWGYTGDTYVEIHISNSGNIRFGHTSSNNTYRNGSWAGISSDGFWIEGWATGYTYNYVAVE